MKTLLQIMSFGQTGVGKFMVFSFGERTVARANLSGISSGELKSGFMAGA